MYIYHTKDFRTNEDLDEWLNSFVDEDDLPATHSIEIVGYHCVKQDHLVVTVREWCSKVVDLSKHFSGSDFRVVPIRKLK